jgi:hypothetical protein
MIALQSMLLSFYFELSNPNVESGETTAGRR